ncbi:unnamed protein product [Bursaphelenchus xylophilus]|uniref:(pine wood nematode) hypothetical protein n=1 Tax=Bursaphelenchus xylophilus TaxID=6326 RepID=A0A1I7RNE6_BURXY|nr:unnamed protein product [Bursaphelenchus xylophilus]CAG9123936.1 unnamed protein product [Bursaphelenchus xylophilus]
MLGEGTSFQAWQDALERRELGQNPLKSIDPIHKHTRKTLYQRDVKGHTGCVNALEFSTDENYLLSGGDDCRVFLWNAHDLLLTQDPKPCKIMDTYHTSNIFSVDISTDGKVGFSAGNDRMFYAHDLESGSGVYSLIGGGSFHRVDAHPTSDNICVATNEDGRFHIVDIRAKEQTAYNVKCCAYSAVYNPQHPELLLIATRKKGMTIRDIRKPEDDMITFNDGTHNRTKKATFARWSPNGESAAAVISGAGLVYCNVYSEKMIGLYDPDYVNSCTMKSCEFIGEDYILCGSDKWDIYAWKIPKNQQDVTEVAEAVKLEGHRSIVNHIRYSSANNLIASSGVEKVIKCWSPYEMPKSYRDPVRREMSDPFAMNGDFFEHDIDSVEEDLATLAQFDQYLRQAMSSAGTSLDDSSDDDELDSRSLGDILRFAVFRFNQYDDLVDEFFTDEEYANDVQTSASSSDNEEVQEMPAD